MSNIGETYKVHIGFDLATKVVTFEHWMKNGRTLCEHRPAIIRRDRITGVAIEEEWYHDAGDNWPMPDRADGPAVIKRRPDGRVCRIDWRKDGKRVAVPRSVRRKAKRELAQTPLPAQAPSEINAAAGETTKANHNPSNATEMAAWYRVHLVRDPVTGIVVYEQWVKGDHIYCAHGPAWIRRDRITGVSIRETWHQAAGGGGPFPDRTDDAPAVILRRADGSVYLTEWWRNGAKITVPRSVKRKVNAGLRQRPLPAPAPSA
jgi:hypothetical protein